MRKNGLKHIDVFVINYKIIIKLWNVYTTTKIFNDNI